MYEKKSKLKIWLLRLCITISLLVIIGVAYHSLFLREMVTESAFEFSNEATPIRQIGESTVDELSIFETGRGGWSSYALYATTTRPEGVLAVNDDERFYVADDSSYRLNLSSREDQIYVVFENFYIPEGSWLAGLAARETFILQVFHEFELVEFRIENQPAFGTEFLFSLPEGYQIHLPIQLSEEIELSDQWENLTIGIFAQPEYHTVDPLAQWYEEHLHHPVDSPHRLMFSNEPAGVVSSFALFIGEPFIDDQAQGLGETRLLLTANTEQSLEEVGIGSTMVGNPPSPWIVSPGEEIELVFALYNEVYNSELAVIDDFVMVGLLNWEQIPLNGQPYLLERTDLAVGEAMISTFRIMAPDEPGYYDFVVFAVANVGDVSSFREGSTAVRFTIRVE